MRRGAKPAKAKAEAKPPVARKSLKSADSRVRDLERRLAEALKSEAEALGQLQTRDRELVAARAQVSESHEQQTATSEILHVISSSRTDAQPVFDAIVRSTARLCDATFTWVYRVDPEYPDEAVSRAIGYRSGLFVPMLREGAPIGVIAVTRAEPGPFTEQQIALLQTFADQAVIAVENVRLFKELQVRTGELTQSVEQLTALGEVSQAVSSTLDVDGARHDRVARHAARGRGRLCDLRV
jgi:two-component system NtrC family sensor kinase